MFFVFFGNIRFIKLLHAGFINIIRFWSTSTKFVWYHC